MASEIDRRTFLQAAAVSAVATALTPDARARAEGNAATRPVVIASANGTAAIDKAAEMILAGADTLDAVIAGVGIVEADADDHSVGLGGLPNEDGVVELDSSVMHGPTHRCGAVAALRNIVHPSQVARKVLERTDHCMLVGEGALRFAKAHGFEETNLLTDKARQIWLDWKETHSDTDDWLAPSPAAKDRTGARIDWRKDFTYGTINCCALDANGDLSGVTTTSGLSFKIPGRVGDSPIIGAGLYVDNQVGAAGATGRGEAVIRTCGSHTVVELMRNGAAPQEACLAALQRISDRTKTPRLLDDRGRPNFQVTFYALSKSGEYGSASMWSGHRFAIYSAGRHRTEQSAYLYETPA